MDQFENEFLSLRSDKPLVLFGHIDDVFLVWTHEEKELHKFIEDLKITNLRSSLHVLPVKIVSIFLNWTSNYHNVRLPQIYISSLQIDTYVYILRDSTQSKPNAPLYTVKHLRVSGIYSMECDFRKHISEMKTWFLRRGYPKNLVE